MTTFLSLTLVAFFVKETIPDRQTIEESCLEIDNNERAEDCGLFIALIRRPTLLTFSFIVMIYSFVYSQANFSLPIYTGQIFGVNGPKFFGMLMSINALTVVLMTAIVIYKTAKLKPVFCISLGGMFYAIGFGMIFYTNQLYQFILSTFIWTIGEILIVTNIGVYIANNTPISHRGRFNAVIPLITGAGFAVSPWLTGKYIQHTGMRVESNVFC